MRQLSTSAFRRRAVRSACAPVVERLESRQLLSGSDFSLDFVAAAPETYDHATGGGAYDDRTIGKAADVVESLEGGDFACGDVVTYLLAINVDDQAVGGQTAEFDFEFLADATGQPGVGMDDIVGVSINRTPVPAGVGDGAGGADSGNVEDGGSVATLVSETLPTNPFHTGTTNLLGTVEVTDLEAGEQVILRVDVHLGCDDSSSPTGNLQAAVTAARVTAPAEDAINVGNQTIPFKQVGLIVVPGAFKEGTKFLDVNADGTRDADGADDVPGNADDEAGLAGWEVRAYADANANDLLDQAEFDDGAEATDTTDADGHYSLSLLAGDYVVVEVMQAGWNQSAPTGTTVLAGGLTTGSDTLGANGYAITLASGETDSGNDFGNYQDATKSGIKFNDRNGDGARDADGLDDIAGNGDDEVALAGWTVRAYADANANDLLDQAEFDAGAAGSSVTDGSGAYSLTLTPGDYLVVEVMQGGWVQTYPAGATVLAAGLTTGTTTLGARGYAVTLSSGEAETGNDFGNFKLGGGGGHTLGYWSNKNGEATLKDDGSLEPELALLRGLNLKNADGTNFDPLYYNNKSNPARSLRPWLLDANATNMAYMLSVQMTAMVLSVEAGAIHAGFVNGDALLFAPALLPFAATHADLDAVLDDAGLIKVNDLIAVANAELGAHPLTLSGSPYRAYQEALKTVLDDANNNLNFVA